ncbi:MAG: hypothetical protein EBU90_21760 [Proteobacteria bacterium]|nr:hypothetical protein [Pseudomonadota bacterium]
MEHEDNKWIQMAMKHIKKGAFTKEALKHHETPMEYAKEVLEHPEQHTLKTRKRAQFAVNVQAHDAPIHKELEEAKHELAPAAHKKAKRAPSAWNTLVKKHLEMVPKDSPNRMLEAVRMAKTEKEKHGSSKAAHEASAKPANKRVSKKKMDTQPDMK